MANLPTTMDAVVVTKYGGPEVLEFKQDHPAPKLDSPADDESVIVEIKAAGVNPVDYKLRAGSVSMVMGLKFPAILGIDYAGKVVAVGPKVTSVAVGDEVYGKTAKVGSSGTYAKYVKLSSKTDLVLKRPSTVTPEQAAGVGVVALTAYVGLVTYEGISLADKPGEKSVLVIGASGGVGIFAVQIAKKLGAKVTAVASEKNKAFVMGLGADVFIDYRSAPLKDQLTKEGEFDVVYDTVGQDEGAYWTLATHILKPKGLFVTSAGQHKGNITLGVVAGIIGSGIYRSWSNSRKHKFVSALPIDQFTNLEKWIADGSLKCITNHTFPLKEAKAAHELSETGRTVGKIVLLP
ncbi:hypothetical protein HK101_008287 [Irineochytrium annulatum]|nr:hypothetical protein HK101_008287 [Irineochytrium annulatum]